MLSLQPTSNTKNTTPHLLPTSIKHNGPIPTSPRYWSPSTQADGTSTAYFRGRKLRGRTVKVPEGYEGRIVQKSEQTLPTQARQTGGSGGGGGGGDMAEQLRKMEEGDDYADAEDENMDEGVEQRAEVKVMETKARFDEVVIWGHEMVPDDEDVYVKGVEEWIGFAEAMHAYETPAK